jgi:hypothetical protein
MKKVSVDSFRSDPMFPRIERVVAKQLAKGNVVAPVGVLIGMGRCGPSISPIGVGAAWPTPLAGTPEPAKQLNR